MQAPDPSAANPERGDPLNSALEDLKALVRDAEEIMAQSGDAADAQVSELHKRLREAVERSRDRLRTMESAAEEHLRECDAYVRTHPYQTVGVAFAVGTLLGLLLGRRSS